MNYKCNLIAIAVLLSGMARATTITVTTDSVEHMLADACTVFAAFDAAQFNVATGGCPAGSASASDTIVFPPGTVFNFTQRADSGGGTEALRVILGGGDIEVRGNGSKFRRDLTTNCAQVGIAGRLSFLKVIEPGLKLHVSDLTFENGCSNSPGGALEFHGGELTLDRTAFSRNHTSGGSALFVDFGSKVLIRNSYFSDNGIYPFNGMVTPLGGAMRSYAKDLRIEGSTFAYNEGQQGAALALAGAGDSTPVNERKVVLINNTFDNSTLGATLLVDREIGSVLLVHNTFTSNTPTLDGAVLRKTNVPTQITMQGNWFSNLGSGAPVVNCAGLDGLLDVFWSINIADDNSCPTFDVRTGGPRSLGYHGGGLVPTRPPLAGSPVIDATPTCTNIPESTPLNGDARGVSRPLDGGVHAGNCDIGAVEFIVNQQPYFLGPTSLDVPHDTPVGLGDFRLEDDDSYLGLETVTATVSHGALLAPVVPNVQCISAGPAQLTCSGRLDGVSTALRQITYVPTSGFGGADTLQLHVVDEGADDMHAYENTKSVALNVIGGSPFLALSATSIAFGDVPVATPSEFRPIAVSNAGGMPMTFTSINLSPQPSHFLLVNNCPSVLNPLDGCTVNVRFTPGTTGDVIAFVTFTGSASNSPLTATLTGRGVSSDTIFKSGFDQ